MKTSRRSASLLVSSVNKTWCELWRLTAVTVLMMLTAITQTAVAQAPPAQPNAPLLQLGVGDEINFQVFGQPDMTAALYIADDGTVTIPLAGTVKIASLSPTEAATQLEKALRDGNYLVNPHVTLTVTQTRSQRVSVLGEIGMPGRYAIDSSTTIFELLAQAGGVAPTGSSTIYILRQDQNGVTTRYPIDLRGLANSKFGMPVEKLQAGDSVYIPKADQFYILGEVTTPGRLSLDPDMTVLEAIAKAGGISQRGSSRRVEIKRRVADNKYKTFSASMTDKIQPEDVVRVKESIF